MIVIKRKLIKLARRLTVACSKILMCLRDFDFDISTGCPNKNATGFLLYCSGNTPPTRLRLYSFEN